MWSITRSAASGILVPATMTSDDSIIAHKLYISEPNNRAVKCCSKGQGQLDLVHLLALQKCVFAYAD